MDFSDECSMYAMEVRDITCLFLELLFTECVSLKQTIGYWKKKKKLDKWWIFLFWISLGSFSLRGPIYIKYSLTCATCADEERIIDSKNSLYTCKEILQEPHFRKLSKLIENNSPNKTEINTVFTKFSDKEKAVLLLEEIKKEKNANHSLIKELLNSGVNIHVTDETGTSALIYALNSRFIKGIPSNENGVHISNLWLYFGSIHAKNKDGSDAMKYSDFTFINELFKSKVHNWPSKIKKYSQKEKDFLNNAIAEDVQAYKFFKKKWLEEELERTQRSLEDDRYDRSLQKKWLELYQQELANLEKN